MDRFMHPFTVVTVSDNKDETFDHINFYKTRTSDFHIMKKHSEDNVISRSRSLY